MNCVIKSIVIVNEDDGIWSSDKIREVITSRYDIASLPYGQVFHIDNLNPGGDSHQEFLVVYDGKLEFTEGDQYLLLPYEMTRNITDICAKYPEFTFSDQLLGNCIKFESQETCYQQMGGRISGRDVFVKKTTGQVFDETYSVYVNESEIEVTKDDECETYDF